MKELASILILERINYNMRCIEIYLNDCRASETDMINYNMRCIEIVKAVQAKGQQIR